jgi:hypothetical protein
MLHMSIYGKINTVQAPDRPIQAREPRWHKVLPTVGVASDLHLQMAPTRLQQDSMKDRSHQPNDGGK